MQLYNTLTDLLADARSRDREIRFIDGEQDETSVPFAELWERALAFLGSLQARGMQPGDELVIFSKSNETFVVAFWAAVLGGIVPVPVAVGISDEHRLKLFRILSQLERATLVTEPSAGMTSSPTARCASPWAAPRRPSRSRFTTWIKTSTPSPFSFRTS